MGAELILRIPVTYSYPQQWEREHLREAGASAQPEIPLLSLRTHPELWLAWRPTCCQRGFIPRRYPQSPWPLWSSRCWPGTVHPVTATLTSVADVTIALSGSFAVYFLDSSSSKVHSLSKEIVPKD